MRPIDGMSKRAMPLDGAQQDIVVANGETSPRGYKQLPRLKQITVRDKIPVDLLPVHRYPDNLGAQSFFSDGQGCCVCQRDGHTVEQRYRDDVLRIGR